MRSPVISALIVAAVFMLVLIAAIIGCFMNGSLYNLIAGTIFVIVLVEFAAPILQRPRRVGDVPRKRSSGMHGQGEV